jgi:hypothetical protein
MAGSPPPPEHLRLPYGSAKVFARADAHAKVIGQLSPGDPFTVLGTKGEYYRVRLPAGTIGFIQAHNVTGSNMPLTVIEQQIEDDTTAASAKPPGGWRGLLRRLNRT